MGAMQNTIPQHITDMIKQYMKVLSIKGRGDEDYRQFMCTVIAIYELFKNSYQSDIYALFGEHVDQLPDERFNLLYDAIAAEATTRATADADIILKVEQDMQHIINGANIGTFQWLTDGLVKITTPAYGDMCALTDHTTATPMPVYFYDGSGWVDTGQTVAVSNGGFVRVSKGYYLTSGGGDGEYVIYWDEQMRRWDAISAPVDVATDTSVGVVKGNAPMVRIDADGAIHTISVVHEPTFFRGDTAALIVRGMTPDLKMMAVTKDMTSMDYVAKYGCVNPQDLERLKALPATYGDLIFVSSNTTTYEYDGFYWNNAGNVYYQYVITDTVINNAGTLFNVSSPVVLNGQKITGRYPYKISDVYSFLVDEGVTGYNAANKMAVFPASQAAGIYYVTDPLWNPGMTLNTIDPKTIPYIYYREDNYDTVRIVEEYYNGDNDGGAITVVLSRDVNPGDIPLPRLKSIIGEGVRGDEIAGTWRRSGSFYVFNAATSDEMNLIRYNKYTLVREFHV